MITAKSFKKKKVSKSLTMKWRNIKGFEGLYQVSNTGLVRSVDRIVLHGTSGYTRLKGKILSQGKSGNGYLTVALYKDYIKKSFTVHRLVILAFKQIELGKNYVNHIDSDKTNNHESNLEWVSFRENMCHSHSLRNKKSKFIGVSGENNHWRATININRKKISLGVFRNEKDARDAYLKALHENNIENRYAEVAI